MEAAGPSVEQASQDARSPIRAAELVGALSLATDLGTGQPLEHALRTAVLAVRLGELAGASAEELADTYYVALLHASGCTSNSHEATQLFGEDIEHRAAFFLIDPADPEQVLAFYRTHVGPGRPPEVRERMIEAALADPARARESFAAMCEVAQRFAGWLGLGPGIEAALEYVFARWDGEGLPRARRARRCRCRRVSCTWRGTSRSSSPPPGPTTPAPSSSAEPGRPTSRGWPSSPCGDFDDVLAGLDDARMWEHALESEPFPQVSLAGDRIDAGFGAIAALTGLKSPWLREHSTGVAELAEAAAWRLGLPAETVTFLRRAALAHDLGRVGVSNAIWEKPGPLGFGEWERVRLHPHFTERAFAQSPGARSDRPPGRLAPRAARRVRLPPRPARVGARPGRPASSPPPTATRRCARRGRTGRRSSRRRPRRS